MRTKKIYIKKSRKLKIIFCSTYKIQGGIYNGARSLMVNLRKELLELTQDLLTTSHGNKRKKWVEMGRKKSLVQPATHPASLPSLPPLSSPLLFPSSCVGVPYVGLNCRVVCSSLSVSVNWRKTRANNCFCSEFFSFVVIFAGGNFDMNFPAPRYSRFSLSLPFLHPSHSSVPQNLVAVVVVVSIVVVLVVIVLDVVIMM